MPMLEGDAPIHKQFVFENRGDHWAARFLGLGITVYGATKVAAKIRLMEALILWAQTTKDGIEKSEEAIA